MLNRKLISVLITVLLACLCGSLSLLGWSTQAAAPTNRLQTVWNATFGLGYYNTAYQIIQTQDGGYLVAGMYGPQGNYLNAAIVKFDAEGKYLWNQSYDMRFFNYPIRGLLQTRDNGYALVGNTAEDATLKIIKTDSEGKTIWSKTYPRINCIAWGLTQTREGGYLITGGRGDGKGVLVKADALGEMQWSKTLEVSGIHDTLQADDDNYVTAGGSHILKIDRSGNVLWDKKFPALLPSDPEQNRSSVNNIEGIIKTNDGGYALLGRAIGLKSNWTETMVAEIIKTDSTGTPQWNKTYSASGQFWPYALIQTSEGGYAFAGTTLNDMILIKTDQNGNQLWNQTFDNNQNDEIAFSMIQTSDGGFALAGKTREVQVYSSGYFYIIKTTSDTAYTTLPAETDNNSSLLLEVLVTIIAVIAVAGAVVVVVKRKHRT
jgi:hypothetical protein